MAAAAARILAAAACILAAAACILAAGCVGGDAPAGARITRDTVGDTIVVHAAAAGAWGDSATLTQELRIGALDGPEEYTFGGIGGLAVDSAGRIYVLDRQVSVVRVYDAEGVHLRDIGREGAGPGEMRRPSSIGLLSDGRLIVRDFGNARFDLCTPDGEPAGEYPMPGGFSTNTPFTVTREDHVYTPIIAQRHEGGGWDHGLLHYDERGSVVDTLRIPYESYDADEVVITTESSRTTYSVPFSPRGLWAMSPEGYLVGGVADRYAILLHRREGHRLRLERQPEPVQVADAEGDDARALIVASVRRNTPGWSWSGPALPGTKPAYTAVEVGADGSVWVRRSAPGTPRDTVPAGALGQNQPIPRWTEPTLYDVWTADGDWLGTVRPPDRFRGWFMRGDRVWGVLRDEDNVEYVARYRVLPTK